MATKKFRTPVGIETQVADFLSPDETKRISANMSNTGVLSFTGSSGQLLNIVDSGSGTIFSANDISGIPSIEVLDTGTVKIAETYGNVLIGTATDNGNKLQVNGNASIGGLTLEGSINPGSSDYAGFRQAGTNLILKGNSTGVSGIFFQSEKDGTNINHPSDYGYIQFHSSGIDGVSGENNKMVIGVANDSPDTLVLQSPYKNGVKISFKDSASGTGGTEYTVWHAGNHGATSGLDADLLDGQQGSYYQVALGFTPENSANKGVANGYASLDATGKVPTTQLPSFVDDVLEFTSLAGFPGTGETGKIYIALDTNKTYRWQGSAYVYITSGAVDSVAGKTGVVTLTSSDVGLGNVDNTSDANKPISTATQTALNAKQSTLVSGTNIKTVGGQSLLGSGNVQVMHNNTTELSTNSTDFNTIVELGTYGVGGNSTWTGSSNGPTSAYGFGVLVVTQHATNKVNQIYYSHNNGGNWSRTKFNASDWTAWSRQWSDLNDGANSGMDSDLLDGQQGSWYQSRANHTGTQAMSTVTNLETTLTSKADTSHKYHQFTSGQYFFEDFTQARFLRTFIETQRSDIFRFQPLSSVETFDGSSWSSWAGGDAALQDCFDGNENTGTFLTHSQRRFRFVIQSNGWPTTGLFVFQTTWTGFTFPTATVTIESGTTSTGAWTQRETMSLNGTNGVYDWGSAVYVCGNIHTGQSFYRVTVDINDWTDSGGYTTFPLRRIMMLQNYATSALTPFSWDYSKNVTLPARLTVDNIITTANAGSENIRIGDDAWIGDMNAANTIRIKGGQTPENGYIVFGTSSTNQLGAAGTGPLTYGGHTVWHGGNDGSGSGLDADLLDGQHGSYYQQALVSGTNIKTINGVSVLGSGDVTISAAGGGITYTKKIANYTALDKDGILADTSAGAFTVTLPSSPTVGMQVWIADGSSWALNSLTITPSTGTAIGDLAVNENLILDIAGIEIHLIYTGQKWLYYYSNFGANGSAITFEKQAQFSATGITTISPIFTAPITTYRGGNFRLTIQNGSAHRYMNFNILHDGSIVQIYDDFFGGSLEIGSTNATITADINTGMLRVLAASSSGQISIKGVATLMVV